MPSTPRPSLDSLIQIGDPTRPLSVDVSWPRGDQFVRGTLTRPAGAVAGDALPAVLLVADGGTADRDWVSQSIPGINGSGRLLDAVIARQGYVTLRYDRRGTGLQAARTAPPSGENRLADSVEEVDTAIEFLASRPEVDPDRVFVVAHDEGALHVLLREQQAANDGVAGIALLAPTGLTLRQQIIRRLGELTEGPEDEPLLARFDAAMAFFVQGITPGGDFGLSPSLQALFENLSHPLNQPYVSEVWNLEVVSLLSDAAPPVLVVIGKADTEVDWRVGGALWEAAAAERNDVRFVYPDSADHVLKFVPPTDDAGDAETGLAIYNAFGRVLDDEAVYAMLEWLNELSGISVP